MLAKCSSSIPFLYMLHRPNVTTSIPNIHHHHCHDQLISPIYWATFKSQQKTNIFSSTLASIIHKIRELSLLRMTVDMIFRYRYTASVQQLFMRNWIGALQWQETVWRYLEIKILKISVTIEMIAKVTSTIRFGLSVDVLLRLWSVCSVSIEKVKVSK